MKHTKTHRLLDILLRLAQGQALSVGALAHEYGVSVKSVSRDFADIKAFFANRGESHRLQYDYKAKRYSLDWVNALSPQELFALLEILVGTKCFAPKELTALTQKLRSFTSPADHALLNTLLDKELYHYKGVKQESNHLQEQLWQLATCIQGGNEITVCYMRMDQKRTTHRLKPASILFADHYFYLIAFEADGSKTTPAYYRIDRILSVTRHRNPKGDPLPQFDEGLLRSRSLFMWPGKLRTIRFAFTGPSVDAVLDKLPTAKVMTQSPTETVMEATVYGDGIKMWLLSQGAWVRVLAPQDFVEEMKEEIQNMHAHYEGTVSWKKP